MTPDQYWNEDCTLARSFREAYKLRRQERNEDLWLQGMYIYHALTDVAPIFRFSMKPQKAAPYLEEPLALNREEAEERKARKERQLFVKMMAKMEARVLSDQKKEVANRG